nr:hypothetical protein [uncultured Albidiferax sp.]
MHTRTLPSIIGPLVEYALVLALPMVSAEAAHRSVQSPATAAPRKRKEKPV